MFGCLLLVSTVCLFYGRFWILFLFIVSVAGFGYWCGVCRCVFLVWVLMFV